MYEEKIHDHSQKQNLNLLQANHNTEFLKMKIFIGKTIYSQYVTYFCFSAELIFEHNLSSV